MIWEQKNSTLALLHPFFRHRAADPLAGLNSFMYGKSVSNQRIESCWGTMRRQGLHWWINFFKDLRDTEYFKTSIRFMLNESDSALWILFKQNSIEWQKTGIFMPYERRKMLMFHEENLTYYLFYQNSMVT